MRVEGKLHQWVMAVYPFSVEVPDNGDEEGVAFEAARQAAGADDGRVEFGVADVDWGSSGDVFGADITIDGLTYLYEMDSDGRLVSEGTREG